MFEPHNRAEIVYSDPVLISHHDAYLDGISQFGCDTVNSQMPVEAAPDLWDSINTHWSPAIDSGYSELDFQWNFPPDTVFQDHQLQATRLPNHCEPKSNRYPYYPTNNDEFRGAYPPHSAVEHNLYYPSPSTPNQSEILLSNTMPLFNLNGVPAPIFPWTLPLQRLEYEAPPRPFQSSPTIQLPDIGFQQSPTQPLADVDLKRYCQNSEKRCPVPGCDRHKRPFSRFDNLYAHVRNVHGLPVPKRSSRHRRKATPRIKFEDYGTDGMATNTGEEAETFGRTVDGVSFGEL